MYHCKNCGRWIGADTQFCIFCGTRTDTYPKIIPNKTVAVPIAADGEKTDTPTENAAVTVKRRLFCEECGRELRQDAKFCSACGMKSRKANTDFSGYSLSAEREIPMYCENCGRELRDGALFCTYCGALMNSAQSGYRQTAYDAQPTVSPEANGAAVSAMVWGIVALATCGLPLGFIVGIVGMNKYHAAEALGMTTGMAKAGKIMSTFGIVLGSLFVLYWLGICSAIYS